MNDLENNINMKKNGLTLKIKVNHQGQVTEIRFSEILDLEYVRFDTKNRVNSRHTAGDKQVHMKKVYDLEFQGQPMKVSCLFLIFLISSILKMLKSTLRSTSYHVCNRRYERSCKKMFDLDFQGQTSRSGD